MRKIIPVAIILSLFAFVFCTPKQSGDIVSDTTEKQDSIVVEEVQTPDTVSAEDIVLEKELSYTDHSLEDVYPYKDTTRQFQWNKIKERLALLENIQKEPTSWAILQNYKNKNKEAPLVRTYKRNSYTRIADSLGVERYQSVPMYAPSDSSIAVMYGRDGWLVKYLGDEGTYKKVEAIERHGEWLIPNRYVKHIHDSVVFTKAVFVDVTNQNITTLEKVDSKWMIRSMNPATTGVHRPPYAQETPLGMFVIQEKKAKMIFLKDGSTETGGFAPWASRFSNGGYIHGVPTNVPATKIIEFSSSLGTTPRSHMCVRNASSHAKFIYDTFTPEHTILFVLD